MASIKSLPPGPTKLRKNMATGMDLPEAEKKAGAKVIPSTSKPSTTAKPR